MSALPKPLAITKDRVVLTRAAWATIVQALEEVEDRAAVSASLARAKSGKDDGLPAELYWRIRAGEHPIRVWRALRKLGLNELAELASVSRTYLSEIETGKKPGSIVTLQKIAEALAVDLDELVPKRETKPAKNRNKRLPAA